MRTGCASNSTRSSGSTVALGACLPVAASVPDFGPGRLGGRGFLRPFFSPGAVFFAVRAGFRGNGRSNSEPAFLPPAVTSEVAALAGFFFVLDELFLLED